MISLSFHIGVNFQNRGTIVVLERYGLALCFLEVFEWWYFSGTPDVRMRYALKFWFSGQLSILLPK